MFGDGAGAGPGAEAGTARAWPGDAPQAPTRGESQGPAALDQIARNFPAMRIALDTVGLKAIKSGNKDFARRKMAARFAWAREDPRELEAWNIGLRLLESHTPLDVAGPLRARLSVRGLVRLAMPRQISHW